MRSAKWLVLLCLALIFLLEGAAPAAFGQYLGQVSIQTVQAQLATAGVGAGTCTGNPQNFITSQGIPNFNNLGQNVHQASATSAAASFTIEIDGIDVLGNIVRISNPTALFQPTGSINGYVSQGSGYYPNIQVSVTCTAAATFSLSYSGATGGSGTAIIGTPGTIPLPNPLLAANVQGIFPRAFNGGTAFPLINGALNPATNLLIRNAGVDTFSTALTPVANSTTGNVILGSPPQPSTPAGEFAIVFYAPLSAIGGLTVQPPWTALNTSGNAGDISVATLSNYTTANALVVNFNNGGGVTVGQNFIAFAKAPTIGVQIFRSANNTSSFTPNANSTLLYAASCGGVANCVMTASDTQGNTFRQVSTITGTDSGSLPHTITVWAAFPSSNAADTITAAVVGSGTVTFSALTEMRNITPANLNTPSQPLFKSNAGALTQEDDNGILFAGNGAFDYTQTVTLTPAGTTTFGLWSQTQHGIFYSCTMALRVTAASGTTPTLDTFFQDSADNIGFNDRMHFPQATAAANYLGAVSGGVGGITPVVTTDGALAVSTKVDGPLSAFGRIKFVVAGTGPSFTVTFNVACR